MSGGPDISGGWIAAGVTTLLASMATAVATLFKISESKSALAVKSLEIRLESYSLRLDESDKKHQECLEDRIDLSKQIARLEGRLSHFIDDVNQAGEDGH